jgi:type II secretory pathway component GspD/PulD (secretin)/beta-lactamase regulating signal transducer with metallopeptidase domain
MTTFIETLNHSGDYFLKFAWPMLWQSSLLIAIIFVLEFGLRRKIRAAIRYALWLTVLVKLLLPTSLALPTSPAWWIHPSIPPPAKAPPVSFTVTYGEQMAPSFPLPPPPVIPPPKAPAMSFAAWVVTAAGVVSAGLLAWLLVRWRQINQKVRRAMALEKLIPVLDETRHLTRLRPGIRLKLTEDSMSPAVCGLFRPVILLPKSLVEGLSGGQLRAVLLHEAIHLRRGDVWVNCAQALLQILYWWHPLLWLANARIRRVREEAVDDAVMLALRDDAEIYAPTLLEVAKLAFNRPLASLGLVGILESRSALRQRIERLVNFNAPKKAGLTVASILGILAFSAVALPMGKGPEKTNSEAISLHKSDLPTVATNAFESAQMVQDGKVLYEVGKLDDAEAKLKAALALNPTNQAARYYLDLVEQSRLWAAETQIIYPAGVDYQLYANSNTTNLDMRVFRVDRVTLRTTLLGLPPISSLSSPRSSAIVIDHENLSKKLGVDLTAPGRSVTFNVGLGLLFVRATPSELDTIERIVQALNQRAGADAPASVLETKTNSVSGIMENTNFRVVLHALEQRTGVETLAEPEAVSTAGREVQHMRTDYILQQPQYTAVTNNGIHTSPGREMNYRKLTSLRLESVSWSNGLPLSEVIRYLAEQSRLLDPDKKGINFIFNPNVATGAAAGAPNLINSATGLPETPAAGTAPETVDASAISVKLTLNNTSLHDVLDAVVRGADHPIKYAIEDYAVVISPKPSGPEPPMLETRVFKIYTNTFLAGNLTRKNSGNPDLLFTFPGLQTNSVPAMAERFFKIVGVDLTVPGRAVAFNDKLGLLMVKATPSELDKIERVIQTLNQTTPQIHVKARFIEVEQDINAARSFDWYLGSFTNGPVVANGGSTLLLAVPVSATNPPGSFPGSTAASRIPDPASNQPLTGILSSSNAKITLQVLESRPRTTILAEPEAVTTSGRQVQMRATSIDLILTNFAFQESSSASNAVVPQTGKFEIGPTMDLVPYVLSDGYTINLTAKVELLEFLGYGSATNRIYATNNIGLRISGPTVRPGFRVQRTEATVNLWDGQTVVLGGMMSSATNHAWNKVPLLGDLPLIGGLFRSQTENSVKKQLMVFVTATIVDPAGNRAHSDDGLPFKPSTVPPQPNISTPSR